MLENYLPVLLFVILGISFGFMSIIVSKIIAPRKPSKIKNEAFECGFPAFANARSNFDVRFYLVAILFIIFDLEIAFLFPWAIVYNIMGWEVTITAAIFLIILTIGFIYEWSKGALEWR